MTLVPAGTPAVLRTLVWGVTAMTEPEVVEPRRVQLARVARSISTEALTAELAAQRGDWEMLHATYERLALFFAEYRLLYVACLGPERGSVNDLESDPC